MFPFQPCSNIAITGCTGSGKTTFVFKLLKVKTVMFGTDEPARILYCYGTHQPMFDEMKEQIQGIQFHEGLPSKDDIEELADGRHCMVLLDDLMYEVVSNKEMESLFVMGSHHRRLTVVYISQNVFQQGRCARTLALNSHYLLLFRNMRCGSQISHLGRDLYPGQRDILIQAYRDAVCDRPYGYLCIDMSPHLTDERYRLRTRILPCEGDTWVYVPRK